MLKLMLLVVMAVLVCGPAVHAFGFFGGRGGGGGGGNGGFHFDFGGEEEEGGPGEGQHFRPPSAAKGHCPPGQYLCPEDVYVREALNAHKARPSSQPTCVREPKDCPCPWPKQRKCPVGPKHAAWYVCVTEGTPCP